MKKIILITLTIIGLTNGVIVKIPELGEVLGKTTTSTWTNRTIFEFLGIKYGLSPSGQRRFLPPEPFPPWNNIYNATEQGKICPQIKNIPDLLRSPPGADVEDCLTLNVFTPKIPSNETNLLPVMVYIHGGAFIVGSAKEFPPNYLLEHDVILVVLQYRLGLLGFLSLETDGIPGNVGLMDQVLALRWVNKHIKNFGGDNTQVTVFGQSAGACSIALHLLSPIVEPYLFQKAIIQSGSAFSSWVINKNPLNYAKEIYKKITNNETADILTMENTFKNISVLELFQAIISHMKSSTTIDNYVSRAVVQKAGSVKYLTKSPDDYLAAGNYRAIPLLAGVTKHEGTQSAIIVYNLMESLWMQNNDDFIRNKLIPLLLELMEVNEKTGTLVDIINNKYFKTIFDQPKSLTFHDIAAGLSDILGSFGIKGQTLKQTKINTINEPDNTYLYTFDYKGEHTLFGYGANTSKYPFDGGVTHSDELLYLFPYHHSSPLNPNDTKIAKLMSDFWANFAIHGKPTSHNVCGEWPPIQKYKNGPYLHINTRPYLGIDFVDSEYMAITNEKYSDELPNDRINFKLFNILKNLQG